MKLELFPVQQSAVEAVSAAFRDGHKRVMLCAPCGFGKSEVGVAMLAATRERGKRGVFATDRIGLCTQISERFDKYGLSHGILMADHWRYQPSEPIQAVTVQTMRRRRWPEMHLLMVDEAHELNSNVIEKLAAKDCYSVGLSATPVTPGLAKHFDVVINAATMNEMIALGRAVPLNVYSYARPDMEGVKIVAGEWDKKQAEKRILQVVGNVVEKYLTDGANRKFICFAWNIAHAEELCRQFIARGVNTATYTANDDPEDRHESVREFWNTDSSIRGLISVKALTRGFDNTSVELLIDAHPYRKAWWEYVQMLGRVMRSHPGKQSATVFDHSGNYLAFWWQVENLFENGVQVLDDGKRKKKDAVAEKPNVEPVTCPGCQHVHMPRPFCPLCGFQYAKKASIEHVPGSLNELIKGGFIKELTKQLYPQIVDYVLTHPKPGSDPWRRANGIYYGMTSTKPLARFDSVEPIPCSPEVRNRILAQNIRYAKGRAKGKAQAAAMVPA